MSNAYPSAQPIPELRKTFADNGRDSLTPRETSVLALIIQGATNKQAGASLGVSYRTIEFHRANIMQKLSARNIADLMRIFYSEYRTK